jgi:hypothetical protein
MKNKQKTKIDFVNILVILVSLGLIIGGFYLIDQKNSKPSSLTKNSKSSSSTGITSTDIFQKSSESSSIADILSSSSSSSEASLSSQVPSSSSSSQPISSVATAPIIEPKPAIANPPIRESDSPASNLGRSQALVRVNRVTDSGYLVEVLDTGYIGGKYWKTGSKINIDASIPLTQSETYNFSGISEVGDSVKFDLITAN